MLGGLSKPVQCPLRPPYCALQTFVPPYLLRPPEVSSRVLKATWALALKELLANHALRSLPAHVHSVVLAGLQAFLGIRPRYLSRQKSFMKEDYVGMTEGLY